MILSACRTPIGSFGGAFKDLSAADLGAIVIREAIARAGVKPADIGDVIMGCVLQAGAGMNVARQAALKAGVPVEVPAETVNRVCGSGLQAVVHAVEAVKAGFVDLILAGGTESMSNAPYLLKGARWGYRMGNAEVVDSMLHEGPDLRDQRLPHGHDRRGGRQAIRRVARRPGRVRRRRARRAPSRRSTRACSTRRSSRVEVPQKKGAPVVVSRDEYPRPGTTAEKLAGAASRHSRRTAPSPPATRRASTMAPRRWSSPPKRGRRRTGASRSRRILSYCTTGVDPMIMGMGPVEAMRKAVERAGLTLDDLDVIELNEAFAAQSLAVVRELKLDPAKVNVHGGAIALGHPIGASGARVLTTLVHALQARGGGRGAASLCIGGGMGTAMIVESLAR